jgi:hypothetical protein
LATTDLLCVATVDYAHLALATLRSAHRHGGHASYQFFALDAPAASVQQLRDVLGADAAWITVFGPDDLGWGRERFLPAFGYMNAFELSCFAKYLGVAHVLSRPDAAELCVYTDADIFFTGAVDAACAEIGDSVCLATPHQLGPSRDADELEHLAMGWLNAGFFCMRRDHADTRRVLDWLVDRISKFGLAAPQLNLFADQSWFSALPIVFPDRIRISRQAGLNVAYWNVRERALSRRDGRIFVNDEPLIFFHFSGIVGAPAGLLSKHDIVKVPPGSVLESVCESYCRELEKTAKMEALLRNIPRLAITKAALAKRLQIAFTRHGTLHLFPSGNKITRLGRRLMARFSRPARN